MKATIRRAIPKDAQDLAVLYHQLTGEVLHPIRMERAIEEQFGPASNTCLLVAQAPDGTLVGTLEGICCPALTENCRPFLVVENVVVSESCRGQGLGTQLFNALEDWARQKNCSSIQLVSSAFRTDAHSFYEKLGFQEAVRGFRKPLL